MVCYHARVATTVHCHQYVSRKANFRLKCAPLFSLPSFSLFLPLLCYLLPIGLTLAHCSLALCQSRFLSPTPSLFLFLLCCRALSPLSLFSVTLQSLLPCVWTQQKILQGSPPFSSLGPFSCFIRAISFFYSRLSFSFSSLSVCPLFFLSFVRMFFVRN